MSDMSVEEFFQKYKSYIEDVAELDAKDSNIFKILGVSSYEIRHSNFIKWLFGK